MWLRSTAKVKNAMGGAMNVAKKFAIASKHSCPTSMPRHISLQDAAAARPFSYLAAGATSISHTKLHTESCTENACSQQRIHQVSKRSCRCRYATIFIQSILLHIIFALTIHSYCTWIHNRRGRSDPSYRYSTPSQGSSSRIPTLSPVVFIAAALVGVVMVEDGEQIIGRGT